MSAEDLLDLAGTVVLILGTGLMLLGAVGLLRMPDVFTRMQASSKSSTLGLATAFIAVAMHFPEIGVISQTLAVIIFAFVSIPVGAHMIMRAAHAAGTPLWPPGSHDELKQRPPRDR